MVSSFSKGDLPRSSEHSDPLAGSKRSLSSSRRSKRPTIPNPLQLTHQILSKLEAIPRRVIHLTLGHPSSATVQRVLQQQQEDDNLEALQQKYAKEIRADAEIQSIQKQIRAMRQQIQQQRQQRERLERKQASQREREQKLLEQQSLKLKSALLEDNKNRRDYSRAISRASNRRHSLTNISGSTSLYKLLLASSSSSAEKETFQLETSILKSMHRTLVLENQSMLVQEHGNLLESSLKRERAIIAEDQAHLDMLGMVLDGTQRAMAGLYPEIAARQEGLLVKWCRKRVQAAPKSSTTTTTTPEIPPQLVLHNLRIGKAKCVPADGISDLGESLIADSVEENVEFYYGQRRGAPVFTSVHALQQSTLQQMAGVRSF